jgi:tellurite resistance protein
MIDPDQYDGFATPEELNLTPEEIQELRANKRYLTAQAKQKIRKLKAQQQTQELLNAAHRIADGGVPLGKLIREGHDDPMTTRVRYEVCK